MRRVFVLALLGCVTGCSNAPIAGFLDCLGSLHRDRPRQPEPGPVAPDVRPREPGPKVEPLPPPADLGLPK